MPQRMGLGAECGSSKHGLVDIDKVSAVHTEMYNAEYENRNSCQQMAPDDKSVRQATLYTASHIFAPYPKHPPLLKRSFESGTANMHLLQFFRI